MSEIKIGETIVTYYLGSELTDEQREDKNIKHIVPANVDMTGREEVYVDMSKVTNVDIIKGVYPTFDFDWAKDNLERILSEKLSPSQGLAMMITGACPFVYKDDSGEHIGELTITAHMFFSKILVELGIVTEDDTKH